MNDSWSVDRDILVHERRRPPIRYLAAIAAIVGLVFFYTAPRPVGILGNLLLWVVFALVALSIVEREEFDRQSRTMRCRGVLGREWSEPFNGFACVQVVRAYS